MASPLDEILARLDRLAEAVASIKRDLHEDDDDDDWEAFLVEHPELGDLEEGDDG